MLLRLTLIAVLVCLATGAFAGSTQEGAAVAVTGKIESGYINVPGGQLYYEKTGQGTPMVLIHDGLIHHEVWDRQFKGWADRFTMVRYDRRGYGKSEQGTEEFSHVDDLLAVFDTLGIESATLMGMSAGGRLAIDFTLEHPERVTNLIIVGGIVSGMPFTDHFYSRGGRLTQDSYGNLDSLLIYFRDEDPYEIYETNTEARAEIRRLLQAYPNNMMAGFSRLPRQPRRPAIGALGEIAVPTLVLVGEFDIPDVHAHAGAIGAGVPGAERVVLRNCGHLIPLERPVEFNAAVLAFLSSAKFFKALQESGVQEAIALCRAERKQFPDVIPLSEARLNQLGYQYLFNGDAAGAGELFKLNVEMYPQSANVYDSYGEALLTLGDTTGAVTNYKKSLELNPDNTNAADVLERLQAEK